MAKHAFFTPRYSERYVAGRYQTAWGDLCVSCGIGTSEISLSIGKQSVIVSLELK
jgi:predicted MPP superfamily phosphohydrolase